MSHTIDTVVVSPLDVNCYIFGCEDHKTCAVIDPGDSAARIMEKVEARGYKLAMIINTHAHADHTGANAKLKSASGALIHIHEADAPILVHPSMSDMSVYLGIEPSPPADVLLKDGDMLKVCPCAELTVIHTPGHSPGGICLLSGKTLFTGDTLFRFSVGRSDLPGGDGKTLIKSITEKLFPLPDDVTAYPGHGESSTIGDEKKYNPFLVGAFR
ncbi:MAG: MBL fold metallo-hydrolase [Nitrospinae bacterium]|nr:MBL fold metallo-hydrolase [Nitrospinota bacterium]MBF0633166.1 MBL fold metallo-hydrolase [Nitrospinota bacterium]